jgi:hypothetical protein
MYQTEDMPAKALLQLTVVINITIQAMFAVHATPTSQAP